MIQIAELIEAEKHFLAIANATNDMIHLNDTEGRIIYANHATEKILGYPINDLINSPAFDIIHPDDQDIIKKDMIGVISNSPDGHLPSREIRLRKKDGCYVDVEVRGFVVELAEKRYIGAIIRNISARKRTEKELDSYRKNLEKMVEERTKKLKKALDEVRTLKGIFPICSFCKKIRDDKGFWKQVEVYIKDHSEADFSHSVCPECMQKHYPGFFTNKE